MAALAEGTEANMAVKTNAFIVRWLLESRYFIIVCACYVSRYCVSGEGCLKWRDTYGHL